MKNKINIAELLKDAPKGTKLYSPLYGEVDFDVVNYNFDSDSCIRIFDKRGYGHFFTECGYPNNYPLATEIMLFPSKDNRSWENFSAPWMADYKSCMNCKCARKLKEHIACDEHPDRVDHAIVIKNEEAEFYYCENYKKKETETHKHFEPFQKVLVAAERGVYDENAIKYWNIDFYSDFNSISKWHNCMKRMCIFDENIIPYEGNEDKLGKENIIKNREL